MHVQQDGGPSETQTSEYVSAYEVEVLAVEGPVPSRVRLSFSQNAQLYQGIPKASVLDQKRFIVDTRAPNVRSADAPEQAASEEETERVLDAFPDLGTRTQIDQVLPEGAMDLGEERPELAQAILHVIHPRAWSLSKGAAHLDRTEGGMAVFRVTVEASARNGVRTSVHGEAKVRLKDSRLLNLSLNGTYEVVGDGDVGTFSYSRIVREGPSKEE